MYTKQNRCKRNPLAGQIRSNTGRTTGVTDNVCTGAWNNDLDRELDGMTKSFDTNVMTSTMSLEKLRYMHHKGWFSTVGLTQRQGLICVEIRTHPDARLRSIIEHQTGQYVSDKTLTYPTDRRLIAESLQRDRPRYLWIDLRHGTYYESVRTLDNRQTACIHRSPETDTPTKRNWR